MNYIPRILTSFLLCLAIVPAALSQGMDRIAREQFKEMLSNIKNTIKKNYYDPTFHGMDLDARFKKAEDRLNEVTTPGQANAVIAQVLVDFNDSHLRYAPPRMTIDVAYGFRLQMIGDKAFITGVKPKSDADTKGLKPGDQILAFEGFKPNRREMWKVVYFYYSLSPRTKIKLNVLKPGTSEPIDVEVVAKVKHRNRVVDLDNPIDLSDLIRESEDYFSREVHYTLGVGETMMWKMLTFATEPTQVSNIMNSDVKKKQNLILDLRGNPGGYVVTLEEFAGFFSDKDMIIANRKGRPDKKKENEPMKLKSKGKDAFSGKVIVLIDHQSASASEIFARFIQLQKRGIVLGDVSAGAVMQSLYYPLSMYMGDGRDVPYGASITNADVIMSDGKSIEHVGVTPDELIIPTAEDLAAGRDPVLARALELVGVKVSSADAGQYFEKARRWQDRD